MGTGVVGVLSAQQDEDDEEHDEEGHVVLRLEAVEQAEVDLPQPVGCDHGPAGREDAVRVLHVEEEEQGVRRPTELDIGLQDLDDQDATQIHAASFARNWAVVATVKEQKSSPKPRRIDVPVHKPKGLSSRDGYFLGSSKST